MPDRDIVWLTLESVRYDRTSVGGHERDTTPFLDRLASEDDSAAFENCTTHAVWTRPSSTSILTGRAPSNHRTWSTELALSDDIPTIPEGLRDAGYRTVGVSPIAQVSAATGLDRGFERFHYLGKDQLLEQVGPRILAKYFLNLRRHSAGWTTDTRKHSTGYMIDALASRHVRRASGGDDPLFLYAHLGDSHHPYYPPKGWRDRFEDDLDASMDRALAASLDMSDRIHEHIANGLPFDAETWNAIDVMYDTSLAYVDAVAESIVETARTELDDPIIVVTADHGEFFGEEGLLAHMLSTHTAVTNVPLVVAGLDGLSGDHSGVVQHADVMRTIVAELGLDVPVPIGRDIRTDPRAVAFTQRGEPRSATKIEELRRHNPSFDASRFLTGVVTSARTTEHRYQRGDDRADLFRLPDESADVSESAPDVAERLAGETDSWLATHGAPGDSRERTADFSPEMAKQLEDLGYL
ncbi:sulfatase [Halorubrum depositum]|uniref:sulfatase n=1 Tax=Halorubrum depositum TaxID=2583992 RepID=UPI0011A82E21|nr:sulfatase [Halorubrum depositum]